MSYIGTSGYSYKDWRNGVFYTPGLPPSEWLAFYMQHFNTLELNITFYRLPTIPMVKRWYAIAEEYADSSFCFVAKGSRLITHNKKMNDPKDALKVYFKHMKPLKEKLKVILWQFPPKFKKNAPRLAAFLKALKPYAYDHCFEFRDPTWFDGEVTDLLRSHKAAFCRADRRDWYQGLEIPDTAGFIYLRRHGPDPNKNYQFNYSEEALKKDAQEIKKWRAKGKEVYLFFNNDTKGAAIRDAKAVQNYLGEDTLRMAA
jgi:uncharacterized protein YecE (DUF72 family)